MITQPSSQQIEPTSHTVIVQVLQSTAHVSSDLESPLVKKTQPLLDDGYRITHVNTCTVRGDIGLVLITIVLERSESTVLDRVAAALDNIAQAINRTQ